MTREPDRFPLTSPDLAVVAADVTDPAGVAAVVTSAHDAVISTYGVPYTRRPVTVYSVGITAITEAMTACGVTRLVCVSSTTVAAGPAPGESWVWRRVIGPLLRTVVGRTLYEDRARMEGIVTDSGLDWTIVRPAGLFDTDRPAPDYQVAAHWLPGHRTSRADLAATLVREAAETLYPRTTIEVITRSQLPTMVTFLRQALGIDR